MSVTINASTSTGLVQSADNSGEIELQSNGTTALKVNTNEGIQILNCLGVGNATPSTSGAGITFPATQSASSDANTLDDYEEGTWTPTLAGASSVSLTLNGTQTYTKIGRQVICYYDVTVASNSVGGQANMSGLPFTSASGTPTYYGSGINTFNPVNASGYWAWIVNSGSTTMGANYVNNNSGAQVPPSAMSNARIIGTVSFIV